MSTLKCALLAAVTWSLSLAAPGQCNNTLYAMGYSGVIYSVNSTNGSLTAVSGTALSASTSNAIAYAGGTTPAFYLFANSKSGSLVFESYVPSTNTFTKLSLAGVPVDTVNAACIAPGYKGYYCLDIRGHIYYYDIASGSWTIITTVILDQTGTDITATVATYSSGDLAFDGSGNLWLLLADKLTSKFGLYEISGPVPTTPVSSLAASQVVALGAKMPDGYDPVGIAFNPLGQMYISTLNLSTFAGNLYQWTTPAATPTLVHSLSQIILDLASCSMPLGVLPTGPHAFTATLVPSQRKVVLEWQAPPQAADTMAAERSTDLVHWQRISPLLPRRSDGRLLRFSDDDPAEGANFYRIVETLAGGRPSYSYTVRVTCTAPKHLRLWPNPAREWLWVDNPFPRDLSWHLTDATGRTILAGVLHVGVNRIPIGSLRAGLYFLHSAAGQWGNTVLLVQY